MATADKIQSLEYVLKLTEEEAICLRSLLGSHIVGDRKTDRGVFDDIYTAMIKVDIPRKILKCETYEEDRLMFL